MENLINKIDPTNLIGKTLEFKHYGKDQVYTIIAATKWGKDKNDIKLALLDFSDIIKDDTHQKELIKILKSASKDNEDTYLRKDWKDLKEHSSHLRFFSICIKNPLMRYEYSTSLNIKDYYGFNLFLGKDLIHDYTFDNYKALSFEEIHFSQLQKAFMNFFYKELGEEYLNQLNTYYTNIIENNVKNKLQALNKERDPILEDYNKIKKIKKEKQNVVKELIKD